MEQKALPEGLRTSANRKKLVEKSLEALGVDTTGMYEIPNRAGIECWSVRGQLLPIVAYSPTPSSSVGGATCQDRMM